MVPCITVKVNKEQYTMWIICIGLTFRQVEISVGKKMSSDIESHILRKYEIKRRLGKGVSMELSFLLAIVLIVEIMFSMYVGNGKLWGVGNTRCCIRMDRMLAIPFPCEVVLRCGFCEIFFNSSNVVIHVLILCIMFKRCQYVSLKYVIIVSNQTWQIMNMTHHLSSLFIIYYLINKIVYIFGMSASFLCWVTSYIL